MTIKATDIIQKAIGGLFVVVSSASLGYLLATTMVMAALPDDMKGSTPSSTSPLRPGATIDSDFFDFERLPATLLLVTNSRCFYCTESMTFYKRLVEEANSHGVAVLFASNEPVAENAFYLRQQGIGMQTPMPTAQLGFAIEGTPTILVMAGRRIVGYWLGQLDRSEEVAVINALRGLD